MKKFVLLLIALAVAPWAGTWVRFLGGGRDNNVKDTSVEYVSVSELTGPSYLYFGERQLMDSSNTSYSTEKKGIEYFFNASFYEKFCYLAFNDESCAFRMFIYDSGNNFGDSVWIQKKPNRFLSNEALPLRDTAAFIVPLMTTGYSLYGGKGFVLDQYSLTDYTSVNTLLDSVYFVYKKDTSYYAYCLYVQSYDCWSFLFQCEFQDDGTTEFAPFETVEYPYPYYNPTGEKCLTKSEYEDYLAPISTSPRRKTHVVRKTPVPYRIDGSRSRGGASSVIIRNGQPEVKLGE